MRHLIDPLDLSVEEIDRLLATATDIAADRSRYAAVCTGKKLATLFYEPSTRTRLSFEAAMLNLGGSVLGFATADSSSATKGESIADTIRVISCYADICAMRHSKEGAPLRAARYSKIPVINAGDGGHQHPTQTLTDLMTIRQRHGRLSDLTIGLCGDLKFGRTVHSLIRALSRYENVRFVLILAGRAACAGLRDSRGARAEGHRLQGSHVPGGLHAGAGHPLHDARPARTLLQRGGLRPPEGQLHPHPRENGARQAGHGGASPAAARERNHARGGRRPRAPPTSTRCRTAFTCAWR